MTTTATQQLNARESFYPNGDKAYYCELDSDGNEHGVEMVWEDNGLLNAETHWCHGVHHGPYIRYKFADFSRKESHYMQLRTHFDHGKKDGLHEEWYSNGKLKLRSSYSDDKLNGVYEEWHVNGQLKERKEYLSGKLNGLHQTWYPDGQDKSRKHYVLGSLQ